MTIAGYVRSASKLPSPVKVTVEVALLGTVWMIAAPDEPAVASAVSRLG